MPKLYMFIGVPGSGKTTYMKHLPIDWENAEHISTDKYIEMWAKEGDLTYNESWEQNFKKAEKELKNDLTKAVQENKDIVYDQTNISKKSRAKKLKMIPSHYEKIAVFFEIPHALAQSVNMERANYGRSIPNNIINNMINSIEPPSQEEGFDQIINERRDA